MASHDKIDRQDRKEPQVPAPFHEFLRFSGTDSISAFFMPYRFAP
jgi:hypothetical protein